MKAFFLKLLIVFGIGYSIYYYFFDREIVYTADICHIYERRPHWDWILNDVEEEYGVSKFLILSVMNQESSFRSNARPPFKKLFGFIPYWERLSSSHGYSQAVNGTWEMFQKNTKMFDTSRTSFKDSAIFISWYFKESQRKNNIALNDYSNLYLSYHEGWGGYNKKTFLKKKNLPKIAQKVNKYTIKYKNQYSQC